MVPGGVGEEEEERGEVMEREEEGREEASSIGGGGIVAAAEFVAVIDDVAEVEEGIDVCCKNDDAVVGNVDNGNEESVSVRVSADSVAVASGAGHILSARGRLSL